MARLLVDIGNTNLKWKLCGHSGQELNGRIGYRDRALDALLQQAWGALPVPDSIRVASVASQRLNRRLAAWCFNQWGVEPRFIVATREQLGVTNAYQRPETLGVDRWLGMIAAHHRYRSPTLIADCGTATTFDLLAADGRHLGGLIFPGLGLMRQSLFDATGIAPQALPPAVGGVATNTGQAIASGTTRAVVTLIESMREELASRSRGRIVLVLTGSDAPEVAALLDGPPLIEPELVMLGLQLVVEHE